MSYPREEHPEVILLEGETDSLSRHLAGAILERYAIPRPDPFDLRKHEYPRNRRSTPPRAPRIKEG